MTMLEQKNAKSLISFNTWRQTQAKPFSHPDHCQTSNMCTSIAPKSRNYTNQSSPTPGPMLSMRKSINKNNRMLLSHGFSVSTHK